MARYYVPRFGRFSRPDPIEGTVENPQRFNRYTYSHNDPINRHDPLGLDPEPHWSEFIYSATWGGGLPGGGGIGFMMWIEEFTLRVSFGTRYFDLPGRENPIAQSQTRFDAMVLKTALADLFKKNPECADMLGGLDIALRLASKMIIKDVSSPAWTAKTALEKWAKESGDIDEVKSGKAWAATNFYGFSKADPRWNRMAYNIFVGNIFGSFENASMQMTVLIHEMAHPANAGKLTKEEVDTQYTLDMIARICGTAVPVR